MRISDWSSDVCSSDLAAPYPASEFPDPLSWLIDEERRAAFDDSTELYESVYRLTLLFLPPEEARASAGALLFESHEPRGVDRKSVVSGKRVSVRVDPRGRRNLTKQHSTRPHSHHNTLRLI